MNLFGEAKSCHEVNEVPQCPHHKAMALNKDVSKSDCCNNKTIEFELDQDRPFQVDQNIVVPVSIDLFITSFVEIFVNKKLPKVKLKIDSIRFVPPLISRDIYVLFETFLL